MAGGRQGKHAKGQPRDEQGRFKRADQAPSPRGAARLKQIRATPCSSVKNLRAASSSDGKMPTMVEYVDLTTSDEKERSSASATSELLSKRRLSSTRGPSATSDPRANKEVKAAFEFPNMKVTVTYREDSDNEGEDLSGKKIHAMANELRRALKLKVQHLARTENLWGRS
ncbi:hypothetical protein ACP4OV_014554 [Aristida adscensionis]